jgi:fibronectin type 3 domain-containing protein
VVTTTSDDLDPGNNAASGDLSEMLAPTFVHVAASTRYRQALEVSWLSSPVEGVAGYRILRGEAPGGPYELVGESEGTLYSDMLLRLDQRYYYVLQVFDATGVRSPYSTEASGMLSLHKIYLPLIRRGS